MSLAPGTRLGSSEVVAPPGAGANPITPYYTVTPDGQRVLLSQLIHHGRDTPLTVFVDRPARLQR